MARYPGKYAGQLIKFFGADGKSRHGDFVNRPGLNVDPVPFRPTGYCQSGGLYFSPVEQCGEYAHYGPMFATVTIPEDAIVYHELGRSKADRCVLSRFIQLTPRTFVELIMSGMNISHVRWDIPGIYDEHGLSQTVLEEMALHRDTLKPILTETARTNHYRRWQLFDHGLIDLSPDEIQHAAEYHFGQPHTGPDEIPVWLARGMDPTTNQSTLFTHAVMNRKPALAAGFARLRGVDVRNHDDAAWKYYCANRKLYTRDDIVVFDQIFAAAGLQA